MREPLLWLVVFLLYVGPTCLAKADDPQLEAELIFPLHPEHNHAPGIVECANGDLIASWYRGSGERKADDVAVYGARLRRGESKWSDAFLMADTPGFPDCNTCMMIDREDRLWLFWPIILANSWESCITQYAVSKDYQREGAPRWEKQASILLKPADFSTQATSELDRQIAALPTAPPAKLQEEITQVRSRLQDKLYQRLGWQPRCKPTVLKSGRILLPLYSDTYSLSIMALSDDGGQTWRAGQPTLGFGAIQPAVVERRDGTLVAYMRENGFLGKIRVAESKDQGESWGPVGTMELPNPGSGLDAVRLASGRWLLIYNDQNQGRNSLALSLSDDEGKSWKWTRHLERAPSGSYHYPAIIQGKDGSVHAVYSYFVDAGKSMKHAKFNEAWVMQGDAK